MLSKLCVVILSGFLSSFPNIGPHLGCRKTLQGFAVTFFVEAERDGERTGGQRRGGGKVGSRKARQLTRYMEIQETTQHFLSQKSW